MSERIARLRVLVELLGREAELAFEMGADDGSGEARPMSGQSPDEEFELVQRCRDLMESELRTYEAMRKESE